ncbi:hypothetical protein WICMUC_001028 [Wickerhamomyces mucosus]|uniref:Uncharacterized protein n=1 Tax=Wickerhamomyces mucosus TaxID=1378264 RepID=A0A9P8PVX9_9ASCO|nr:hypothetical protein WICMUC_001028 [Wickerhamomyces mucosus]
MFVMIVPKHCEGQVGRVLVNTFQQQEALEAQILLIEMGCLSGYLKLGALKVAHNDYVHSGVLVQYSGLLDLRD